MSQCGLRGGSKRSRKMKGAGYGYDGGVINAGNIVHAGANTSEAYLPNGSKDAPTNAAFSSDTNGMIGGRKSRKSRKTRKTRKTKKSRKTRGRRMRGGAWNTGTVNAGAVGYGYSAPDGGVRGGIAPVAGYNAKMGGAPMGGDGVRRSS